MYSVRGINIASVSIIFLFDLELFFSFCTCVAHLAKKKKKSCLEPIAQLEPSFDEIVIECRPFNKGWYQVLLPA